MGYDTSPRLSRKSESDAEGSAVLIPTDGSLLENFSDEAGRNGEITVFT